jgi:hypothetical protein
MELEDSIWYAQEPFTGSHPEQSIIISVSQIHFILSFHIRLGLEFKENKYDIIINRYGLSDIQNN